VSQEEVTQHIHRHKEEAAVRETIEAIASAVRRKDVDAVLALRSSEIRFYGLVPPLQHVGTDAVREVWKSALDAFEGPVEYEVHRLDVAVGDDIAFSRSLNHFGGTQKNGERVISWLCTTLGFGKTEGVWKLLHQHVSVPFDMETGKALLDLTPP